MANANGWGDGSVNNNIGWGQGANNTIGWGKSHLSSWSGLTDIDGGNLPVNSVAPAITGTAQEGQTLTCSTGTWSGSPTYTYQWKRNGNNIGGATSSTYLLVTADVGQSILCTVTATNFVGSATANSNTVTPTSSVDADAQAFITAASITDPTQQSAINTLVTDLKGYGVWTKMRALYPFVGGTSSTHKWNLKDPRDLDAAFRLVFSGGVTHSINGVQFGGVNGFGDTKLNCNLLTNNDNHLSIYSRTNSQGTYSDMGASAAAPTYIPLIAMYLRDSSDQFGARLYDYTVGKTLNTTNTDSRGFYNINRVDSTGMNSWKHGVNQGFSTYTNTENITLVNKNIYIGSINLDGTASQFSNRQYAFASIGSSLTNTEAANFYTAVQTFQTTLGRQV